MSGEVAPSPAYAAGVAFAVNQYACLLAIDVNTASQLWKNDSLSLPNVASPLATGRHLLIAGSDGEVNCLDPLSGKVLWTHTFDKGFYASPILVGDHVYLLDMAGVMHIFKADTPFQEIAAPALGEGSLATPAFAGGRVYIRGEKFLYCLE
jgi:outer membrane protein assembly factor BamB